MSFTPKFVDLVRNYTTTTGTADFVLGAAVNGYSGFGSACQAGDSFYYSAIGIDKPIEREVGRGTLNADGTIGRDPVTGIKTSFTTGLKTLSLIAAAEWFNTMQANAGVAAGSGASSAASRSALAAVAQQQSPMVLAEAGREGLFLFDAADHSAKVAADPYQGIYVAPSSDATGASGAWVRQFTGPICLEWFGVADGAPENAARVESAISIADPARGNWILLPYGLVTMDRRVVIQRPCRIEGHGMGNGNGGGNTQSGSTLLIFPSGSTGFRIKHSAAIPSGAQTEISNLRIAAAGTDQSTATGSFDTASAGRITLSSGLANVADNEVVALEGAGKSFAIADRTFTLANGATSGTWVSADGQFRGNSIGYIGQVIDISGAGLPAGTVITAWGAGTFSVSNAATSAGAANGGASATITAPLIAEVQSGGGTATLTVDSSTYNAQNASGTVLRHAAAGVMASIQCSMRNVEVMGFQIGLFLHGNTTGGEVCDNGLFTNCTFNCTWAGVVCEGYDAQVNSFVGCNFAGPEVGVLDASILGNDFHGCHWAFNCGIMVPGGAPTKIVGGYMESGTSYLAPVGSSCSFLNTVSMIPGTGWNGTSVYDGIVNMGQVAGTGGEFAGLRIGGTNQYMTVFSPGPTAPQYITYGADNIRAAYYAGTGHWWDVYPNNKEWRLDGSPMSLWHNATGIARTNASGFDLYNGKVYQVNGTQVVGGRGASLPADATDLASAIALVNAIKARLKATGGHGLVAD